MKTKPAYRLLVCILLLTRSQLFAQVQLEFGSSSYPTPPNGPSISNQTAQFLKNSSGTTFINYAPVVSVTASWSNQQFTSVAGMPAGKTFGSSFGSELNAAAKTAKSTAVFDNLGSKSAPASSLFTASPYGTPGTGIDTANNYGFNCFTTAEPLYAAASGTNGRYYYSNLTLTFNRPVANPVLHIIGLGGTQGSLGFSTELELQTAGVTLDKLSGTGVLNVTSNKILNSATTINSMSGSSTATTGAATGSIRVTGNNITTLVFKVYFRGDGGGANWSSVNQWTGDRWLLGISMSEPIITGNIFDDANGLAGTPFNTIDGTGTNAGGTLYANLVDGSGNVVLASAVAADGAYMMQDMQPASYPVQYKIVLSTTKGVAGAPAPAAALPAGWVNTGEFLGTGAGNDGTVNGILPTITIANSATTKNNANFGIDRLPGSDPKLESYPSNTPNTFYSLSSLSGTDSEDGALGTGDTYIIKTLPTGATLYYNLVAVTANQIITNFDPSLLVIDPLDATLATSFNYAAIDAAGFADPSPASFTINWSMALPVSLQNFTATKYDKTARLQWTVSDETDSRYTIIEHSANGLDYKAIGQLAASGNNLGGTYSFTDNLPVNGKNYYRLKFVSNKGSFQYSPVKYLLFGADYLISTYPNPVQSKLNITLSENWMNNPVSIDLYSPSGELIISKHITVTGQTEKLDLSNLPATMYILKIAQQNSNRTVVKNIQVTK